MTTPAPVAAQSPAGKTEIFDFENATVGTMPSGFSAALTGGGAIKWTIVEDSSSPSGAKVLTEISADVTDYRFPIAILESIQARGVEMRVRFKAVAGRIDRAAGLVARLKDKDNYYIVRANALEDNIGLYKVVGGRRIQFGGVEYPVPPGRWHELGLAIEDDRFYVTFNGRLLFSTTDRDRTFTEPGRVGLWTKADSLTRFDGLTVTTLR
ncbi:MAG: hypothetical protein EXQ89_03560 [Rhodospirillaceae bacterium]|nr:hypothetical protein [Rhodospirillaceae bacterium]